MSHHHNDYSNDAERTYYAGAPFNHIAAYRERQRIAGIDRQCRDIIRRLPR